jgi:DNA anti-recombination protein RmuC
MLGLEGKRITEMSREIMKTLKTIKQESHKFSDNLGKLNRHVSNAKNTMDIVNTGYASLADKIDHVDVLESNQTKLLEDEAGE